MTEEVKTTAPNIKKFNVSIVIDLDIFAQMRDTDLQRYAIELEAERTKQSLIEHLTKELIK